jgi:hypothetical protein
VQLILLETLKRPDTVTITMMCPQATKLIMSNVGKQLANRGSKDTAVRSKSYGSSFVRGVKNVRPYSSLHETSYASDLIFTSMSSTDELDPCTYGYRVVCPPLSMGSMDSSYEEGFEHLNWMAAGYDQPRAMEASHYDASHLPVTEFSTMAVSLAEKGAVFESHKDWDAWKDNDDFLRTALGDEE